MYRFQTYSGFDESLEEYLFKNIQSSVFHSQNWLKVISESSGLKSFFYCLKDKNEFTFAFPILIVPNGKKVEIWSGNARFETIYGGPVFGINDLASQKIIIAELIKKIKNDFKRLLNINIEASPGTIIDCFKGSGFKTLHNYDTPLLDLRVPLEELWNSLDYKSTRYEINKAIKLNLLNNINKMDDFNNFYECMVSIFKRGGNYHASKSIY